MWLWILIVVVLVIIVAVAAMAMLRQRRTAQLRQRFGPEYDRAVGESDNQRAAEAELLARQRQRDRLDIRPLPEAARVRFAEEWRLVQERFVDQPSEAAREADQLVSRVMAERGYPMGDFAAQAGLISVDHPDVVENFRIAHSIQERAAAHQASTEDLRVALLRYRSLFEELLRPEPGASAEAGAGTVTADGTSEDADGTLAGHGAGTAAGTGAGSAATAEAADGRPGLRTASDRPDVTAPGPEGSATTPAGGPGVAGDPAVEGEQGVVDDPAVHGDRTGPAGESIEAGRGARRTGTGLGADDDVR